MTGRTSITAPGLAPKFNSAHFDSPTRVASKPHHLKPMNPFDLKIKIHSKKAESPHSTTITPNKSTSSMPHTSARVSTNP